MVADSGDSAAWIETDARPLMFHAVRQSPPLTLVSLNLVPPNLVPLNQVIPERYAVYWKVKNKST
jgi:hypothetical protein